MSKLLYDVPAKGFEEALPIGQGKLGAMVYGGTGAERVQINEDTMWYGSPMNRINPSAKENLGKVRELIRTERISEAQDLLWAAFSGTPEGMRRYQTGGDLSIGFNLPAGEVSDYKRELDLSEAIARVSFSVGDFKYEREYFASFDHKIIAIGMSTDNPEGLDFHITLSRDRTFDKVCAVSEDTVEMTGNLGSFGLDYIMTACVKADEGSVKRLGEHIMCKGSRTAYIYLYEGTTYEDYWEFFRGHDFNCDFKGEYAVEFTKANDVWKEKLYKKAADILHLAKGLTFEQIKDDHITDYKSLFDRLMLSIPVCDELEKLTTTERLARIKDGKTDDGLIKTYFDYGRYLMISGSRPGSMPLNLQGIWNDSMTPPWDSKYTININTEMNYWGAECANLSECHEPLFELIKKMSERGKETAEKMYGCRGFAAHHNTDIWADTAPQDLWIPGTYWVLSSAWLCSHLWNHYEYNPDKKWLKEIYGILENAVLFMEDFVTFEDGRYVISPSVSPENTYIMENGERGSVCANSTMDVMILRELLSNYLKASDILGISNDITVKAYDILDKLPKTKIGKHGQIMEWEKDYDEVEPGHRHISHLYDLWPARQITPEKTPELSKAAEVTLERRLANGGGYTGWSCAWLIMFFARLNNSERAYYAINKILAQSTLDNLMDGHPMRRGQIFQIDGNLGAFAAIIEMLVTGDSESIHLLPACPKEWQSGALRGAKVRGGYTVDFKWDNGEVTDIKVSPEYKGKIYCGGKEYLA